MRKNWKVALCVIGCCGSMLMNVCAQEINNKSTSDILEVVPCYIKIARADVTTQLSKGIAKSSVNVYAYNPQTISVHLRLEQYRNDGWNTVKSWSISKGRTKNLLFSKSTGISKGYKYRTVAVIDCGGEKVTKYSSSVSY